MIAETTAVTNGDTVIICVAIVSWAAWCIAKVIKGHDD